MTAPSDRRYLDTHEWHRLDDDIVTLGITQFAADELTDITFVDLPQIGQRVKASEAFGEIESVKATGELYSGISGSVVEVNQQVVDNPGLVNTDPFGQGWLIKIKPSDPAELEKLLTAEEYAQKTGQ